jgi:2-hydroxychromene-2-carboxylate isomerase
MRYPFGQRAGSAREAIDIQRDHRATAVRTMPATIDVFFEFSSPYSYLAAQELPALAARHSRILRWRPVELARIWDAQGVLEPYKAVRRVKVAYILRDAARVAAERGIPLIPFRTLPDVTLARLATHRLNRRSGSMGELFVLQTWRKLFAEGADIGSIETLTRGLDGPMIADIEAAKHDAEAAAALERANQDAINLGCFGVPWMVADGEIYFGQDRIYLLDRYLQLKGSDKNAH